MGNPFKKDPLAAKSKRSRLLWLAGLTGATTLTAVSAGPFAYETYQNEKQRNRVERSLYTMIDARFYNCDPAAAGAIADKRRAHLFTVANNAFADAYPKWSQPLSTFRRGAERLTWEWPAFTKKPLARLPGYGHIAPESRDYAYRSRLDDIAATLDGLAALGVGICYDARLAALNAGSAFSPQEGILSLNPNQAESVLSVHAGRHLARLEGALTEPYREIAKVRENRALSYRERFDTLRDLVAQTSGGPAVILTVSDVPQQSKFVTLKAGEYAPPVLKQEPPAPAKKTAPAPGR